MSETITRQTFKHLVRLAELEMDAEEAEYLRQQLNNQLDVIQELAAIPLDEDIAPSLHGVSFPPDVSQPLRQDTWKLFDNIEGILDQVPDLVDNQVIVPDIPHTDLE
jgi:aspartyl/glutamyl-tRNA(Asn/Gln) amidotransferase C subunit